MGPESLAYIIHTIILVYFLLDFFPMHIFFGALCHVVLIIYPDFLKLNIIRITYICNSKESGNKVDMHHIK
jgi:hypothetical protein